MRYYVNKNAQPNGDHEVHASNCAYLPVPENRIFLGDYPGCDTAITKAKLDYYRQSNGCSLCAPECHTG